MKIEGTGKTSGTKGVSKSGAKKSGGDGAFGSMVDETGETASTAPVSRTGSIGALGALLILQDVDGDTPKEAARKARKRADDLLGHLDKIRVGLLTGELPESSLQQLARTIAVHRDHAVIDPKLAEILDAIDLRAQVELAKLGQ